jgi:hypothetical protein
MSKRFKNAYEIWSVGASNPVGVTNALLDAMREARDEGGDPSNDAAVQVILDHLCFLCGLPQPSLCMEDWDGRVFNRVVYGMK